MKINHENFHQELQRILSNMEMVFYGVFILWKFITQSLDEPERQIIYFFRLQLSRRRSMPTSKRVHTIFCQTYITFYEPFHHGIYHWSRIIIGVKLKRYGLFWYSSDVWKVRRCICKPILLKIQHNHSCSSFQNEIRSLIMNGIKVA